MQTDKSYLILDIIKEAEANESISHWKITKKIEVNNKHKHKYGKLKTILSIWYFKRKRLPDRRLMKHKYRICAHGRMQQWGVK